jgi:FkbM family methyltransferase
MVYLDVGANDGLYTLFASRLVGPTGRVLAFEPSGREFSRLEANLRLNGIQNVRALKAAAGDRSGVATLKVAGFGHEGHNTLGAFAYDTEQQSLEEVPVVTLDDSVHAERVAHVGMIKIDAEGAELAVLKGAQRILRTHRPLIQLEFLEAALAHQGSTSEDVRQWLRSFGYRFYVFGRTGRPEAVTCVKDDGINAIAVHSDACEALVQQLESSDTGHG